MPEASPLPLELLALVVGSDAMPTVVLLCTPPPEAGDPAAALSEVPLADDVPLASWAIAMPETAIMQDKAAGKMKLRI
jgi:hypothetical protein